MEKIRLIPILEDFVGRIKTIYQDKLIVVSLFGSYARGDYTEKSDVDLLLVLDIPTEQISQYDEALCEVTYEFSIRYNVNLSPITINKQHFQKWMTVYPLYINICREGVILYESTAA